ncbi:protein MICRORCHIDIA 7-like [Spinacia oleracea]|uniref:Protein MICRORCHIDIA 7-like n=1 Tax=Spinacia oleracea TaxID=3562 RepID=A0ABM3QTZ8_SPIOL|nr:protein MICRORCHIDIA 7-like [Spinacia oleracea]
MEVNRGISVDYVSSHFKRKNPTLIPSSLVNTSGDENDSVSGAFNDNNNNKNVGNGLKKPKMASVCDNNNGDRDDHEEVNVALPVGFLDPLLPFERELVNANFNNAGVNTVQKAAVRVAHVAVGPSLRSGARKQFWKAGDYEASSGLGTHASTSSYSAGMDHVRVHPRFLHSNATSHKWALGAFAELLDNALDEVCNGATYVKVDMIFNQKDLSTMNLADKDRNRMLLVQDNGGGMTPDKMRQCMSLGYSAKSKMANTIGQYGNGFKTSTMRLGADVIVFSTCQGKNGSCPTRSIGMLSYTFLTSTGKEDIVVPMIDYEKKGQVWTKMLRSSNDDWHINLDTIIQWSPFSNELELLQQFNSIGYQGTIIVIYNLWEDDEGQLELDFGTDSDDIQIRGVNRDEKKIAMAKKYPNSKHFLTYQHSLRSYASVLYLKLPPGFRMILRGKDVEHHNLVNDMMHRKQVSYRPIPITDGTVKDSTALSENLQASVTLGFVKDAQDHIDIQGFNVYHKNRLIKPFWRVWNAAGSDGRGVIGVLEANFVEPAHDKQGFERTTALARLEARLIHLQKNYWRDNCHEIGYSRRRPIVSTSVSPLPNTRNGNTTIKGMISYPGADSTWPTTKNTRKNPVNKSDQGLPFVSSSSEEDEMTCNDFESPTPGNQTHSSPSNKVEQINGEVAKLRKENLELKKRLEHANESRDNSLRELQFERDRSKSLEAKIEEANKKIAELDKEQEAIINIFGDERERRDVEEEKLRKRLQEASTTIEQLLDTVRSLERINLATAPPGFKSEPF